MSTDKDCFSGSIYWCITINNDKVINNVALTLAKKLSGLSRFDKEKLGIQAPESHEFIAAIRDLFVNKKGKILRRTRVLQQSVRS